jgi:hypothetical protein
MSATVGKSATESPLRIKKSETVGNLTPREQESAQAKSGQSADLVVARIMSELDLAECLQERRHIVRACGEFWQKLRIARGSS